MILSARSVGAEQAIVPFVSREPSVYYWRPFDPVDRPACYDDNAACGTSAKVWRWSPRSLSDIGPVAYALGRPRGGPSWPAPDYFGLERAVFRIARTVSLGVGLHTSFIGRRVAGKHPFAKED